jgi:hypothetical protein
VLTNSIVAGNYAVNEGDDLRGNPSATLAFAGGNIVGSAASGFGTPSGPAPTIIDGTDQTALETVFAEVALADPDGTGGLDPFFAGVLADNGGAVQTIALNPDAANPAIDTGTGTLPADTHDLDGDGNTTEALPVDARGFARDVDFDGTPPTPDLGAFEQQNTQSLVVTTLDDELDAADTNLATVNLADLSLREALALANDDPTAGDTITFAAALSGGRLFMSQDQELAITTDGISIDGDIDGDGDADITIDADSAAGLDDAVSRVFLIDDGNDATTISATLNGLVIRDGNAPGAFPAGAGGGIFVGQADALTLTNATVSGNSAGFVGGGIFGNPNSSITLTNATVSGNSANYGGGIFGFTGSSITLTNATLSGNSANYGGGILGGYNNPITLTNSTVTGNSAGGDGGGIYNFGANATTTLSNSIVAGNAAADSGDDLYGGNNSSAELVFTGGNIIGSAPANFASQTGAPTATIDGTSQTELETVFAAVAPVDPDGTGGLDPFFAGVLADNGGRVPTIALNPDAANPAIDTGTGTLPADSHDLDGDGNTTEALPVDARGFARDVDFDGTPPTPDLGAFEQQNTQSLVVTTLDDELDLADTNFATVNLDDLSLREALALANGDPTAGDTITFAAALSGGTLFLSQDQHLAITTDGITIDGDIDGDGDADITIDADSAPGLDDAASRVFLIEGAGAGTIAATLNGLVIRDGNAALASGGGIYVGYADALTLTNATVSGNSAGGGGGIFGHIGSSITLTSATVSGNSAVFGGGIFGNIGSSIVLTNATVSGNGAAYGGGGTFPFGSSVTLTNATVSGNSADYGGGSFGSAGSSITLTNSIVAGNDALSLGDDLAGNPLVTLTFAGGNIVGSAAAGFGTVNGTPTATIDGADQAALETVFAQVANDPNTGVLSGVLADNGGAVQTVAIASGGIAHNGGANGELPADDADLDGDGDVAEPLPVDARGFTRAVGTVDIGAFEQQNAGAFVVTTLADEDFDNGDLAAETADGNGLSLREALGLANGDPTTADTITFAAALTGGTLFLAQGNGELEITTDGITIAGDIDGNGTADITISADTASNANDATSRVFHIHNTEENAGTTISAVLNGLIIQDGNVGEIGGGIYVTSGNALTLSNSSVIANDAHGYDGGGGIAGGPLSKIALTNSNVTANNALGGLRNGGGISASTGAVIS